MYSKKTRPLVVAGIILHSYQYAFVVIARDSTNTHKASKASDKMRVMHGQTCKAYGHDGAMPKRVRREARIKGTYIPWQNWSLVDLVKGGRHCRSKR